MHYGNKLTELNQKKEALQKQLKVLENEKKKLPSSSNYLIVDPSTFFYLLPDEIENLLHYLASQLGLKTIIILGKKLNEDIVKVLRHLNSEGFIIKSQREKPLSLSSTKYFIVISEYMKKALNDSKVGINNSITVGYSYHQAFDYARRIVSKADKLLGWKSRFQLKKECENLVHEIELIEAEIGSIHRKIAAFGRSMENKKTLPPDDCGPRLLMSSRPWAGSVLGDAMIMHRMTR